jgi:hypothetical protein
MMVDSMNAGGIMSLAAMANKDNTSGGKGGPQGGPWGEKDGEK